MDKVASRAKIHIKHVSVLQRYYFQDQRLFAFYDYLRAIGGLIVRERLDGTISRDSDNA